ncbi:hypothetical protein QBC38DRAFT_395359 [Podospora fimiseda]|uniref:Uncharacterized protein n=1 Tax=Podospora fimiseda TaxID=252190 RepID=A0AAN7BL74_9PEZI|nr:hypothetical protein QBC38DRAFT_395359 [Podospora fimiseda]
MADRQLPSSRAIQSGISKPRMLAGAAGPSTNVRRNLFQNHPQLTRRPTAGGGSSTSDEIVRLDASSSYSHHHHQHPDSPSRDNDIVVRNHKGEIELNDPPTPPIDDPDEIESLEEQLELQRERQRLSDAIKQRQANQTNHMSLRDEGKQVPPFLLKLPPLRPSPTPSPRKKNKGYKNAANSKSHFASTTELLEEVKDSLRGRVAALAEDNWMFEREELPRRQL